MKVIINPEFKELHSFILDLPYSFDKEGTTIYKARNEVKVFNINGIEVNVKKYRIPIFFNRIIYSFFRKSKAERAYKNALEVIARGIDTPIPIAYTEIYKNGLLNESFFACLQCPYTRMFREFDNADITGKEHIIESLARYAAKMHENNIYHLDFSIGNILFEETPSGILFSIVDLNRMQFIPINQDLGCKNFERLRGTKAFFETLAKAYAEARGFDIKECTDLMINYHSEYLKKFNRHKEFKRKLKRKKN